MVKLLSRLIRRLSDTIHAWDRLQESEIDYFLYDGDSRTSSASLKVSVAAVGKTFSELSGILRRLKDLETELRKNKNDVSHLSHTELEGKGSLSP